MPLTRRYTSTGIVEMRSARSRRHAQTALCRIAESFVTVTAPAFGIRAGVGDAEESRFCRPKGSPLRRTGDAVDESEPADPLPPAPTPTAIAEQARVEGVIGAHGPLHQTLSRTS
jgi:hypothetical protein